MRHGDELLEPVFPELDAGGVNRLDQAVGVADEKVSGTEGAFEFGVGEARDQAGGRLRVGRRQALRRRIAGMPDQRGGELQPPV